MKKVTTLLLILLILLFLISCELFTLTKPDVNIYGMFVGLDYKNSSVGDLNGTLNDAKEMAASFYALAHSYGIDFEGYLALQEGSSRDYDNLLYPSKTNLIDRIEEIGDKMDEDDLFILYYAGHGLGSRYFDNDGTYGYLVTAPEGPAVLGSPDYTPFSMDELSIALQWIPGVKVIILDSCFSGQHVAPYPRVDNTASPNYDPRIFYLTASMEDQESWEGYGGDDSHGYFTYYFLNYLGWDQEGNTDIEMYANNSIDIKELISVKGEFSADHLDDLPPYLSLEDIANSIKKHRIASSIYQEKKMTSGPTNVLLFHEDWK